MIVSPYLINMVGMAQDSRHIYILLEYISGGEFFTYLRTIQSLQADVASWYAAQVVIMFSYLHKQDIVYRDLKPENLLIDSHGYLKLTDFGFAKIVVSRTYTLCGTPEYIPPETLL